MENIPSTGDKPAPNENQTSHKSTSDAAHIVARDWLALAKLFQAELGPVVFWQGEFYFWDDKWNPASDRAMQSGMYKWLGAKASKFKPSSHKVKEVLNALKAVSHLHSGQEPPFWIERRKGDAAPSDLLPFRNGVLNLQTGEFVEPNQRLFSLHRVEANYDPEAEAPEWDKFLLSLFPDDPGSRETIEEMLGYSMASDRSQQKVFMLIGPPRSGKGTIGRVLAQLIGRGRYAGPTVASFSENFGLQQLIGKTAATIADARSGRGHDPYRVVERMLSISGQDHQAIPRKYLTDWEGTLPTQLWWMSNELPKFADPSGAIATRLILIQFAKSFLGQEDTALDRKLYAELSGIANRALAGYKRLHRRGYFQQPEAGEQTIRSIDMAAHPVRAWLADECEIDPSAETPTFEAYTVYCDWCDDNGFKKSTSATFGKDLQAAVPQIEKKQHRIKGKPTWHYIGLRVKPDWIRSR